MPGEPEGKGLRGTRTLAEFRRQVAAQLRAAGHHPMTGPVALDLSFVATRKNPAAIHRLAKWALDALEPSRTRDGAAAAWPSLYRNDRQVKLLHVSLRQGRPGDPESPEPGTSIRAQPLRDVVEDMRVAGRLVRRNSHDGHQRNHSPTSIDAFLCDAEVLKNTERVQTQLLTAMDRLVEIAMTSAPYHVAGTRRPRTMRLADEVQRWEDQRWNDLLSFPLTLPLPSLPVDSRERSAFRDALRSGMEEFRRWWPILHTPAVPIKVTLLVVPPRQGKDLDNLALEVLPAAQEVLSMNQRSVTAYQVIELKPMSHHPPTGLLRLTLGRGDGSGHATTSPWTRAHDRTWQHFHAP